MVSINAAGRKNRADFSSSPRAWVVVLAIFILAVVLREIKQTRLRPIIDRVEILLRLAGVKPNSEAIRIMISACRLAIDT